MKLNDRKVVNVEIDGVDTADYPDFCDAYFSYAEFEDTGTPLSDDELEILSDKNYDIINEMAFDKFF